MGNSTARKIAEAIRQEMADGRHRPGETLPSVTELRARFGAAAFAVRRALHLLRDEGLVTITKHVGAVVTDKAAFAWKGRVAFIHASTAASYFDQRLAIRLSQRFGTAGWAMDAIFLEAQRDGWLDDEPLRHRMACGFSFAIVQSEFRQIAELLDQAAVPYVVLNGYARDFPSARAVIRESTAECYGELIGALKERNVRTIQEFDYNRRMDRNFQSQIRAAGISVRRVLSEFENEMPHSLSDVMACGHQAVARFLANPANRAHLPDVILFDDDYIATGGIVAMLEAGLRIPEDVRVVAYANRGNELITAVPLARIENNPDTSAELVADYVLALLAGRRAAVPRLKLRFVPGESL